jgi:hypothetical protein
MRTMRVVNVVPNDHSNETNDDSEPSVAVNPSNVDEIVVTAFTPPEGGNPNGPLFFSVDGGETWSLKFDIPGGEPHDQSPAFAETSGELYMGVLRGDSGQLNVLRGADPSTNAALASFDARSSIDQPWMEATTVIGGVDDGKDRIYVGYNDDGHMPQTASVDVCLDAAAASPSFHQVRLDPRSPSPQDSYEIRPTVHSDGTVYVAYKSWTSTTATSVTADIVVARDDDWGAGGSPFTALVDPDGKAGKLVATGVVINDPGSLGGIRLDNDLSLAVDPSNSDVVYIVWCDNAGPNYTLRVRRSTNRGVDWSGDLLTVENASLACSAINSRGRVGLLYQQLVAGEMETHFQSTIDGTNWDDTILARTATTTHFTGDYGRLIAVGLDFFGAFPAMNQPDPANFFPNGGGTFKYQRNTSGTNLVGLDGTTVVGASVDPFFFKVQERDCVVVTDRSSFGKDEVDALLHQGTPAVVPAAFYVTIDGFRASDLGISAVTLSGTPDVAPSISFNPGLTGVLVPQASMCVAEDSAHLSFPQRFTWVYPITFVDTSDFDQESRQITLTASMTSSSGITVGGSALLTLTTQPNPYEIDGPTSWLSVDLQVFHLAEGGSLPSTPGIVCDAGPSDFITRLLANTGGGYNDPALARAPSHPFDVDLLAHADTSTVTTAGTIGFIPVYNFAVARVRYRALSTPAAGVRCFFRLFNCSTISTEFQPTSTYLTGGLGGSKVPLLGVVNDEVMSIPCFASDRVDPTNVNGLNAQPDPVNVGPVGESIPPDGSGAEVQVYFGCWLDINQTALVLPPAGSPANGNGPYTPARSVQEAIRGSHQCLVAEINMDPPEPQIATGQTPATSDKLAQRNLTIVPIASPHQAPMTFDIKPTPASEGPGVTPDEIMFEWDELPHGSTAQIYLPGTSADEILALADKLYLRHDLARYDAHTVICAAQGITYMPVPPGVGSNYAGLLTVEVPPTAKRGQTYKVVTRQLRNTAARVPLPLPVPGLAHAEAVTVINEGDRIRWRRVIGSFQLSIPVKTKPAILPDEERLLSVLRFIFRSIPITERWHPVWKRYLDQIAGRVSALGGDPGQISGSSSGEDWKHLPPETVHCHTGKIAGLIFDRYGDFEGFVLDTKDGERRYLTRERNLAELIQRAWRDRLRITVCTEHHNPHHPETITLLQPPVSLED